MRKHLRFILRVIDLRKNKRAYSRLLKQRKFKIENLENELNCH